MVELNVTGDGISVKTSPRYIPSCHLERRKTSRADVFGVELSKICNELRIFERQNARGVLRIYEGEV